MDLPKRYDPAEAEPRWQKYWEDKKIFAFDPKSKAEIYSIDTPPPTVSGAMHIGHAFSFSQQDFIARYQRMRGKNVFQPFGTDDNGLATERLIEKMKKVKGNRMQRDEFIKLCLETLEKELRPAYIQDWKRIGMSCDWDLFYTTISDYSQEISQRMFLDLVKKKRVYRKFAPVMVCPQCHTAIAQVELEDLERDGTLYHVQVEVESGEKVTFATTRPELMTACIAITIHPDDERYTHLVGKTATIPVSNAKVPILADDMTKMEFGSGVVYWCPYGDINDIEFTTKHPELEVKHIMNPDGALNKLAGKYEGLKSLEARKAVVEDWKKAGAIVKEETTKQVINVHERCGTPIEFVAMNQWFIKYLDLKQDFVKRGKELNWYPDHMRNRYENWVEGLKWDWCISRQRFSGVPFPVWYDKKGKAIFADESQLPVDPFKDKPQGHEKEDLEAEKDVMDTWATSALTPQLAVELVQDESVRAKLLPMNLRPQAHDIITFWLFNTVVRSHMHHNQLPWKDVMISGWALDPRGKKMSKSKGNVVHPQDMIKKYSADALRFWAAGSRLGDDLPFQDKDLLTGQKFVTKIWNASKFAYMHLENYTPQKATQLDLIDEWMLTKISKLIKQATESFEKYEYSKTKLEADKLFWHQFCDNYLEIAKDRLYNPDQRGKEGQESAQYTLYHSLLSVLKIMAPITPYIAEELYSHYYKAHEKKESIHVSSWPQPLLINEEAEQVGDFFVYVLQHVRKTKSESKLSMKEPVKKILCKGKFNVALFDQVKDDLQVTTKAEEIVFEQIPDDMEMDQEVIVDIA